MTSGKGRTFAQDMTRGEGNIPTDGLGPGHRTKGKRDPKFVHDDSVLGQGGLADQVGNAAKARARHKADSIPGGGGGPNSAHRKFSQQMAKRHAGPTSEALDEQYAGEDAASSGTSIFDPVLCELAYRWFCAPGGWVLDPFAGGSVRGIVASRLGRRYVGVDLRPEQIAANNAQAKTICGANDKPEWVVGDALDIKELVGKREFDFVFSCPPYADLEVYSEDPRDISTMEHADFRRVYSTIIVHTAALLKPNRFACFVVGDVRDKNGFYYGLPAITAAAFKEGGLELYNQAILVTAAGSLPVRVRRQFESARKLGNTHQYVLVFVKGDPRQATQAVGPCEVGDIGEAALPSSLNDGSGEHAAASGSIGGEV